MTKQPNTRIVIKSHEFNINITEVLKGNFKNVIWLGAHEAPRVAFLVKRMLTRPGEPQGPQQVQVDC